LATHDKVTEKLIPDSDILESVCIENEKDRVQLEKRQGRALLRLAQTSTRRHRNVRPLKDPVI
jgi:hypothetical protein